VDARRLGGGDIFSIVALAASTDDRLRFVAAMIVILLFQCRFVGAANLTENVEGLLLALNQSLASM
jgi:hypothetical protein